MFKFKKNETLAFILALVSTMVVLSLGYGAWTKIKFSTTATSQGNSDEGNLSIASDNNSNTATPAVSFSAPGIVPMGISVKINGSSQMEQVNKLLKRSFQKEFPGTTVNVGADGSETGVRLLLSGQVDLAAIARPLNQEEKTKGLTAISVKNSLREGDASGSETFSYAYRQPPNLKVEAFLGHLLSAQGQEAITNP